MKVLSLALAASLVVSVAYADGTTQQNANNSAPTHKSQKKNKKKKAKAKTKAQLKNHKHSAPLAKVARAKVQKTEELRAANTPDSIKTSSAAETSVSAPTASLPSAPTNVSTEALQPSAFENFQKHAEFSYFGIYRGAPVNNPGGSYQPNVDGSVAGPNDGNSAQSMESYITTGYKPDKDTVIGIANHFFYNGSPTENANGMGVGSWELLDPQLMISRAKLIDKGQFKVKGYLYAEIPVTQNDYLMANQRHMITSIAPTANITYDFKDSRFSMGLYTYLRGYVPGADTPVGSREYRFYMGPNANYQITPTFAATMWIDLVDYRHASGTPFMSNYGNVDEEGDIEPGVSWDVIPGKLTVNPVINIYPGNPTLNSTSFQAVVIGRAW